MLLSFEEGKVLTGADPFFRLGALEAFCARHAIGLPLGRRLVSILGQAGVLPAAQVPPKLGGRGVARIDRDAACCFLGIWYERFSRRFFEGRLGAVEFRFEATTPDALGEYWPGRPGTPFIAVDLRRCSTGWLRLHVLLHEMIHAAEELERQPVYLDARYHTTWFRERALELGIPANKAGQSFAVVPDGPFAMLMREYGIATDRRWRDRFAFAEARHRAAHRHERPLATG